MSIAVYGFVRFHGFVSIHVVYRFSSAGVLCTYDSDLFWWCAVICNASCKCPSCLFHIHNLCGCISSDHFRLGDLVGIGIHAWLNKGSLDDQG